ncbi:YgfZ/GcvT domain-containing protein [Gloeobacter kilaueensis]|uniref:Folate-binding protein YgfZ n=1 Tax=Gloeobacter kilaueensis (strain ATCC BAA-2537 / CCAP 1431/1 / ULC 316 / JS1) TaxID=1183438 RepID=U5QF46_GLOK1|nr:glycine cleavage T C-terminal barrel domain-containing protein [Gloeobacter kilaueensis]AGY56249.1 folate-binding protein YgfZ [Gloeobacter kilaueensis JS1]
MPLQGYYADGSRLLKVRGKDAADYLQRVLTCNLKTLAPDGVIPGALLTGQGKIVAPFRIYTEADGSYTLETPGDCAETLQMRLERYVFSEDVSTHLIETQVLVLVGGAAAFEPLPQPDRYRELELGSVPIRLSTVSPGDYRLHLPPDSAIALPVPPLTDEQYELWRIERGIPAWGKELNDNLIPLHLGIDRAFAHDKGCYTGQEVISRATFVTQAPLELVGLVAEHSIVPGSELTQEGDYVGVVTSAAFSEARQATLAIARVRRQKAPPGTTLQTDGGAVQVVELPFC